MSFQLVPLDALQNTRALLETYLPKSAMMLNMVSLALNGKYPDGDRVNIYRYVDDTNFHDENESTERLFLVITVRTKYDDENSEYTAIYSPEEDPSTAMLHAFSQLFDWTKPHLFGAILLPFKPHMERVGADKGGTFNGGPCTDFYLPLEAALALDVKSVSPDGQFELDHLSPEHAPKVNSHWRYGDTSEDGNASIGDAISSFRPVGIFRKNKSGTSSRTSDELVSWILRSRVGTLSNLYTLEGYRRRGLAAWTLEAACKGMAEDEGLLPICEIEDYNKESRGLVEKVGFKVIHNVYWMHYIPPKASS